MFSSPCSLLLGLIRTWSTCMSSPIRVHLAVVQPSLRRADWGQVSHYQGETGILKRLERPRSLRGPPDAPYFSMEQFNTKHLVNPKQAKRVGGGHINRGYNRHQILCCVLNLLTPCSPYVSMLGGRHCLIIQARQLGLRCASVTQLARSTETEL